MLGAVVGVMGTLQAVEALKVLLGIGSILSHRFLLYDALECRFAVAKRLPDPDCPLCGAKPTVTALAEHDARCTVSATRGGENHADITPGA